MDTNNDGVVDESQFRTLMRRLKVIPVELIERFLQDIDPFNNQKVRIRGLCGSVPRTLRKYLANTYTFFCIDNIQRVCALAIHGDDQEAGGRAGDGCPRGHCRRYTGR